METTCATFINFGWFLRDVQNSIIDLAIASIKEPKEVRSISLVNRQWNSRVALFLEKNKITPIDFFSRLLVNWTFARWYISMMFTIDLSSYWPKKPASKWAIQFYSDRKFRKGERLGERTAYVKNGMKLMVFIHRLDTDEGTSDFLFVDKLFPKIDWAENRRTSFFFPRSFSLCSYLMLTSITY